MPKINTHEELNVYKLAFDAAMRIFEESKRFPRDEVYSLTNQMRRSSRSVCANVTEAWRKRRYEAAFISKLSDAESEAAETQTWLRFAHSCGYLALEQTQAMCRSYDVILGKLVTMINNPGPWLLNNR